MYACLAGLNFILQYVTSTLEMIKDLLCSIPKQKKARSAQPFRPLDALDALYALPHHPPLHVRLRLLKPQGSICSGRLMHNHMHIPVLGITH